MDDAAELRTLTEGLDTLSVEDRSRLYQQRKRHKENAILLHEIGHALAVRIPGFAVRQLRRHMLAEEACHMASGRRQAVIQGRWNHDFDDGLLGPAVAARIEISLLHIGERRRDDDSGCVMIARLRQTGEPRQLRERHIHANGPG